MSKKKANKESFLFPLILNNNQTQKRLDLDEKEKQWLDEKREIIIEKYNLG